MTKTRKKKLESRKKQEVIKHFKKWRLQNNIIYCYHCGKKLSRDVHHFMCNDCYKLKENVKKELMFKGHVTDARKIYKYKKI